MFKHYVDNEQFNLQINRFINDEFQDNALVQEDLKSVIPQLIDTESWYTAWFNKATEREKQQEWSIASVLFIQTKLLKWIYFTGITINSF